MIQIDISNIWGQVDLPDLLAMEKNVFDAHLALTSGTGLGAELRFWQKLPSKTTPAELEKILAAADQIRSDSQVCVVVAMGDSSTASQAAIQLLQGSQRNLLLGKDAPQIFYAGNNLSTRHWHQLVQLLEGKDFSLILLSSGEAPEPGIALRSLKWMLERRYGTEEANNRIYAVTGTEEDPLHRMAKENSWQSFSLPADVGEGFQVFTAAGLLPLAVAGIDIEKFLAGAAQVEEAYDLRSFENPLWLYTGVRNVLHRNGMAAELLGSFEPDFQGFGHWWQQLFAGAEGKDGKGLIPMYLSLTEDLPSLGQMIQDGRRNLFETLLRFAAPEQSHEILSDVKDLDGLNYLAGMTLDQVEEQVFLAAVEAHSDSGAPVITLECGELNEETLGELFYFFQLSSALSAYILEVDPFHRPGTENYRQNLDRLLGKPQDPTE